MKKIFLAILLTFVLIINTFSYEVSEKDKKTVEILTIKINGIIQKKGEKTREIFVTKLYKLKEKVKSDERLNYIIGELLNNINSSVELIENIIKEVETSNINNESSNDYRLSSLLLVKEYISLYNTLIDDNVYGRNGELYGGCGYFADRWNTLRNPLFQDIYDKANEFDNVFLMDLIEYDIVRFNEYFEDICKSDARIDKINFKNKEISNHINQFDNSYYIDLYNYYNNWYTRLHEYLKDKEPGETCAHVVEDWEDFTYDRLEFLKNYTGKTNSPKIKKYFEELQNKFRNMIKQECGMTRVK